MEELPAASASSPAEEAAQQPRRPSKDHSVKIKDGISEISKVMIYFYLKVNVELITDQIKIYKTI